MSLLLILFMIISPNDLFVQASQIPGAGMGLFTHKPIPAGTIIVEYTGNITTWKAVEYIADNGYLYYVNRHFVIDALADTSALARYANDADGIQKIKGLRNNCIYIERNKKVFIQSTRTIPAGREIFVAYGKEYWDQQRKNLAYETYQADRKMAV